MLGTVFYNMIRGTIEFNSNKEKVFLPELICDMFIGVMKPNQMTIDEDSYLITKDINTNENDIVFAELNYYEKTCSIIELDVE
jgi:hypothetical protein